MIASHPRGPVASIHERSLLTAAQRNDRHAQEELIRRYEPLVRAVCARVKLPFAYERSDLFQEARIGLLCAIRSWQPQRAPFPAFARLCVRRQVFKALDVAGARKHQLLAGHKVLDQHPIAGALPVSDRRSEREIAFADLGVLLSHRTDDPRALELTTRFANPVAILLQRERLGAVVDALPTLTDRERTTLTGTLDGKSHEQLAAQQGCSVKATKHALCRARRKLAAREQLAA